MPVFDPKPANSKWSRYDVSPLLALDPRNAPPASLPGAGASTGAFGSPAPAAGGSPDRPAFVTGPVPHAPKGSFEATSKLVDSQFNQGGKKADKPFYKLWQESDKEEQDAVADQVEQGFKMQGKDMIAEAHKLIRKNPAAMKLAEEFGIAPPKDKAGKGAFRTQEDAVAERGREIKRRDAETRRKAGGFLMEMGLRILASQRPDAGGAIGEGALATMDARRQRRMQGQDRKIAMEELKRQRKRDTAADRRAEERLGMERDQEERLSRQEGRLAKESEARIRQINHNISAGNIEVFQDKEGKWHAVRTDKEGPILDAEGNPIEGETQSDLTANQMAVFERQVLRDRADIYKRVKKQISESMFSNDPEIQEIIDTEDAKKKQQMIDTYVDREMQRIYQGATPYGGNKESGGEVIDFNDL